MTEAERLFSRFPDFIKEYIYRSGWESFRDVQLDAAEVIFGSDKNLLLSSATASGKTEAAFLPILTDLCDSPVENSVAAIYIAPLKSLINDQFARMDELLYQSGVPLHHWHGDVSASHKAELLRHPSGILQITPESLESMLINRSNDLPRLFGGLRWVVIDEVHTLFGSDRGNQIICLLSRLSAKTGAYPRRIGLSATVGDLGEAARWLGEGSGRDTAAPIPAKQKLRWRLGLEHFYINESPDGSTEAYGSRTASDPGYEYLYSVLKNKHALVFSNSREETEYVTATLRQIAERRGDDDVFMIHHGNLSASLREDAENRMREGDRKTVTCATVTMELGVDIGRLERVAQIGSPHSVASFLQRLGRSGRSGEPSEMFMLFREEAALPNTPLPQLIPWDLLRAIAIIELYTSDGFIEPPLVRRLPFSLAFHQTLCVLASFGELKPAALAERMLSMPPFASITREEYKTLLISMIRDDFVEATEEGGLIVGLRGEKLTSSFKFYAVFQDSEDYTVRCESEEIGTITTPPPVGDRFALAGYVWEVLEVDAVRRLIFVRRVGGKMEISWPGGSGEIHTRLLEKMHEILVGKDEYKYLFPSAAKRLVTARRLAATVEADRRMIIPLGGRSYCMFPWLGTRSFRTLRRYLSKNASRYGISDIQSEGCCYITFRAENYEDARALESALGADIRREGIIAEELVGENEAPVFEKFDGFVPKELLRRAYAADRLAPDEVEHRFSRIDFRETFFSFENGKG